MPRLTDEQRDGLREHAGYCRQLGDAPPGFTHIADVIDAALGRVAALEAVATAYMEAGDKFIAKVESAQEATGE